MRGVGVAIDRVLGWGQELGPGRGGRLRMIACNRRGMALLLSGGEEILNAGEAWAGLLLSARLLAFNADVTFIEANETH